MSIAVLNLVKGTLVTPYFCQVKKKSILADKTNQLNFNTAFVLFFMTQCLLRRIKKVFLFL